MEKDYIIAPERIIRKLDEAEQASVAINGLMEDVIDPAFYGDLHSFPTRRSSDLTGGDKGSAALRWMEKHFDELYAACYAVNLLAAQITCTLQTTLLKKAKEKDV